MSIKCRSGYSLVLASLVFVALASAHEAEDSKNSEIAESANNVESADVELLRMVVRSIRLLSATF